MLRVTINYQCLHVMPEHEKRKRRARALCGKRQHKVKWKQVEEQAIDVIPLCQQCRNAVLTLLATNRRLEK
jgi:N6-adenosine-specific RNA methylase IME4